MTPFTRVFKRSRPLLGTFLTLSFSVGAESLADAQAQELLTSAFAKAAEFEKRFSLFDPESEVSKFNRVPREEFAASSEFRSLVSLASEISSASSFAFDPYCGPERIDFNGIAKGACVDALVDHLSAKLLESNVEFTGCVNGGGDLRFFGTRDSELNQANLRLGPPDAPVLRTLELGHQALATSSLNIAATDSNSTTKYQKTLRDGLDPNTSAVVIARSCAVADALTKVGLFAPASLVENCAKRFSARILLFDRSGELVETYGTL